jgi:hypothetical protein
MYSQLYGAFAELRKGVALPAGYTPPAARELKQDDRVTNFYGGMSYDHARGPAGGTPPPPAPNGSPSN